MTYTKLPNQMLGIEQALASVLLDEKIEKPRIRDDLLLSGVTVELDTGEHVWVACVANDDPGTHQIEMLAVAIAGNEEGPLMRANGSMVYSVFARGVQPSIIADVGMKDYRKGMMLAILGAEPEEEWMGLNDYTKKIFSIRTHIAAYRQVAADLEDVLD